MAINYLDISPETVCECGKCHSAKIDDVIVKNGAVNELPSVLSRYNAKKVFVVADVNTYEAAGKTVCSLLDKNNICYSKYIFNDKNLEPDEKSVGSVFMHFDNSCDTIVAVGSGVINDICKILANISKLPYIIVGTAPSMDGYASATSSMARDGVKVSLNSKCPDVIIGDIDIVKNAPMRMLQAGLGDMLAKYVGVCEWKIANIISGEYYCERIATLVRTALEKCVDNADGLLKRDDGAVAAVFEGLIITGLAMSYAGVSRPASGGEHYMSHVWDMRALEFGLNADLHGIQCAYATLLSARLYQKLKTLTPDRQKALDYVNAFDFAAWGDELRAFLGSCAEPMIALEEKEQKYNKTAHAKRLEVIINKWQDIVTAIDTEMPSGDDIFELLTRIGAPKTAEEIGVDPQILPITFKATKDIRDKYVLSRLVWDLGVIEDYANSL